MGKHKELSDAIQRAVDQLNRYDGEEIAAHEHPLHLAIQEVEKLCRERRPQLKQTHSLPCPAAAIWYHLLSCSRGRGLRYDYKLFSPLGNKLEHSLDSILPKDGKQRTLVLATMLSVSLRSVATMVRWYDICSGDLPIKTTTSERNRHE